MELIAESNSFTFCMLYAILNQFATHIEHLSLKYSKINLWIDRDSSALHLHFEYCL